MPKPEAIEMDAREAVRRVVKLYGPALEEKHIQLGTSIASEPLPILGDSELLHRALSNLVLNAMDAMPGRGNADDLRGARRRNGAHRRRRHGRRV